MRQHLFAGQQLLFERGQQVLLLRLPMGQAATTELAFLVTDKKHLVARGDEFLEINIVQLETHRLDLVFKITPENGLLAFESGREQVELQLGVNVAGNVLGFVAGFKDDLAAVLDDGHGMVLFAGQLPDHIPVHVTGQVGDIEFRAGKLEHPPLHDAERAPGELDQFNHAAYLREVGPAGKSNPKSNPLWQPELLASPVFGFGLTAFTVVDRRFDAENHLNPFTLSGRGVESLHGWRIRRIRVC